MATALWSPGEYINPGDLRQPRTTAAVVPNQLTNPSFETGDLTGWTVSNPGIVVQNAGASFAFDGIYVIRHPDGLLGTYFIDNDNVVPVLPGQIIKLSCRYRRETDVRGRQSMAIEILWFDSSMVLVPNSETLFEQAGGGVNVWYDPSVTGIAPATAAYAQARVRSFQTGTGGTHHQYFDAFTWDYIQPTAPTGLVYKAVQAAPGFTDSVEPVWPITLGLTVVDNEVTWEAVIAANVTWEAIPIMKSSDTEPTWPLIVDATILDGTVAWKAASRRVEDERCPNTKIVIIGAQKVFAADGDIINFSATINPLDWSTPNDAGYIPFGLQLYGSNPVAAMGLYRSNLVALNAEGFQMWQIDPDPALMAFLDAVPIGSTEHDALQPVMNDLAILNPVGVRNFAIAAASTNLQADGVGEPIDPLVTEQLRAAIYEAKGLFWPARGQYWLFFGPQAFVLTITGVKKKSWSRYVFPEAITDWTLQGNDLYLRTSGNKVWKVDDSVTQDDVHEIPDPSVLTATYDDGDEEIDVTWTEAVPESEVDYYRLYYSLNGGAYTQVATVNAGDPRVYVQAGSVGTHAYSVDFVSTTGVTGPMSNIDSVTLAVVGGAVAVGTTGAVASTDLVTWTAIAGLPATFYTSVAFSPSLGLFAVLTNGSTPALYTSPDSVTWTSRSMAATTGWVGLAWASSLGLFCAVRLTAAGAGAATSPDGITWTVQTTPNGSWTSVVWVPWLNLFVAGQSTAPSTTSFMTSPDGVTWTQQTSPALAGGHSLTYSDTSVLVCNLYNGYVARSLDAVTWTTVDVSSALGGRSSIGARPDGIVVSAAGVGNRRSVDDGLTWSAVTLPGAGQTFITWVPAVGVFVMSTNAGIIATSPDGVTWASPTSPVSDIRSIASGFTLVEVP